MGDQFQHQTNEFQDKWNNIFSNLGADIILGDHSHTVQPLQYIENTLVVNSPGNFANSFIKFDGDSTALIDIYIHKKLKKVVGASAIPMYTKELSPKYFSAIPIYDLIKNESIILNEKEKKRIEEIQLMSTKVLVGKQFGINDVKKVYFFINNSYHEFNEKENNFCKILNKYSENELLKYIVKSNSITFIGDSITEGTKNDFHPWYEPIINCFKNKTIINISKGSYTTKLILNNYKKEIINSKSELYIIALGTNDVRYRDSAICSMNSKEYIFQIEKIINISKNKKSKFVLISPWFSFSDDIFCKLNHAEKKKLLKEYSMELQRFSKQKNYIYIDVNDNLEKIIVKNRAKYMVDFIHPNNKDGIELYCEEILKLNNK